MKTSSMIRVRRARWLPWLVGAVASFLLGGVVATYWLREPPLLAGIHEHLVGRREDVQKQYIYASRVGTEEAWQAVISYFPDRPYYVCRAKQQLGRLYLRDGRLEQAMSVFKDLAALEDTETELRAFGLAGQCAVLSMQKKYRELPMVLDQLWPIRSQLKDPMMRQVVNYALRANRANTGSDNSTQKWQEWLNKHFSESG